MAGAREQSDFTSFLEKLNFISLCSINKVVLLLQMIFMGNNSENNKKKAGFRFRDAFLIIIVLLLLLSLFTHNSHDLSVLEGGVDSPVKNWIGPVGADIARLILYLFGVAAYPIIIFLVICAIRPLLSIPTDRKGYIGALIAVILGITIIFAMWPEKFSSMTDYLGIGHRFSSSSALSGGVIGQRLAAPQYSVHTGIIRRFIGTIGTAVIAVVFLVSGGIFIWLSDWRAVYADIRESRKKNTQSLQKKMKEERILERERNYQELRQKRERAIEEESLKTPPSIQKREPEAVRVIKPPVRKTSTANYILPPVSLLEKGEEIRGENKDTIEGLKNILQSTIDSFNVEGTVVGTISGPRVTRYEISLAPGVKVERITSIANNIAMDLQAESIRILAPIPGKNTVGVEVPNRDISLITLRSIMESPVWENSHADIPIVLGKDVAGKAVITDLSKSPHLLIAGATGSGKSVCMNTLLMSLLYRFSPDELRLIMVDPKVVEFEMYNSLPHLITPIVNDPKKVPLALRWAVNEMEIRYRIFSKTKARNLTAFNSKGLDSKPVFDDDGSEIPKRLPFVIIIIDELADIMMTDAKANVENSIARIAQKGRAAGIHMVIATQTPRIHIITGVIKANLPTRIAFQVPSIVDSRVILDQKGADKLLGRGDMLFIPPGSANLERIQGAIVSDREIEMVVRFVADQAKQEFNNEVVSPKESAEQVSVEEPSEFAEYIQDNDEELVKQAIEIISTEKKASTSYIQRRLKIGYNRAAEIIDILEKRGIIGPAVGASAKREILVSEEKDWGNMDDEV